MNGKDNIINKILSDAEEKCNEILAEAQNQATEISQAAQKAIDAEKQTLAARLEKLSAESLRNGLAGAKLSSRKYELQKKQTLVSACYQNALLTLQNLSGAQRKAFLHKLLQNYAEDGETVFVSKADATFVDQKFLDSTGKKLVLGKGNLQTDGGLLLQGEGYDKDLSLKNVVAYVREQTEGAVATALFGE